MSVKISDIDRGMDRLLRKLRDDRWHTAVGVLASAGDHSSGVPVAVIASVHELNSPTDTVPGRPFIRPTVDGNRKRYQRLAAKEAARIVLDGAALRTGLNRIGLVIVGDIKQRISSGIPPALKPETIRRKGSTKPLIDTGQLRASITHEVRRG